MAITGQIKNEITCEDGVWCVASRGVDGVGKMTTVFEGKEAAARQIAVLHEIIILQRRKIQLLTNGASNGHAANRTTDNSQQTNGAR